VSEVPAGPEPLRHDGAVTETDVVSFCRICNAMCGIVVTREGERIVRVRGDESHALSRGYTCPKGRALGEMHHHPDRLDRPEMVVESVTAGGAAVRSDVSWDFALDDIEQMVRSVTRDHGADAIGMYLASGSAFDTNGRRAAERFLAQTGSRQKYTATTIDTPCKPLVAELVGGWSGLTPVWDSERSKLLILVGSNPVVSHGHSNAIPDPVRRFRDFRSQGGRIIVLDPRRTETAALADVHLQLAPGSDAVVLGYLVRSLLADDARVEQLRARTTGTDAFLAAIDRFTPEFAIAQTGLSEAQLQGLLDDVVSAGRISALSGTGSSMNAAANVTEWLLWALHIVTDSYDRPGGMWFNPGYLMQLDTRTWEPSDGVPEPGPRSRPELPRRFGEYPCAGLVSEIESGNLRVLFVVGGNPSAALPDRLRTEAALASLDALIVLDVVDTETTRLATHVLPVGDQLERADLTWLLDGYQLAVATQYTPAVVPIGADRRPVWKVFAELGERLGLSVLPRGIVPGDATDESLFEPILARSRSDSDTVLSAPHGVVESGAVFGWVTEQVLPDGKWRIAPDALVAQCDEMFATASTSGDGRDPGSLLLIPQRRLRTMNSQMRDVSAPGGRREKPSVVLAPEDAAIRGIATGDLVSVESTFGVTVGPAEVDPSMRSGSVGMPHGWIAPDAASLTSADRFVDPLTGMVLQSGLVVTVTKATA
jgi:anaerobic selenocysteine-containing dehydrogenase